MVSTQAYARAFSDEVDAGSSTKMRPINKLERISDSIGSKSALGGPLRPECLRRAGVRNALKTKDEQDDRRDRVHDAANRERELWLLCFTTQVIIRPDNGIA